MKSFQKNSFVMIIDYIVCKLNINYFEWIKVNY